MDWAGWAIFGLIATAGLTVVMIGAQLAGFSRLDLPLMLGTLVVADPDRARVAGFFRCSGSGMGDALLEHRCQLVGRDDRVLVRVVGMSEHE